jgi:hypothetical protein
VSLTDDLLGAVVAGLLTALRAIRPSIVRRYFALANQHMRWQLNDLARRCGPAATGRCGTARQHRLRP